MERKQDSFFLRAKKPENGKQQKEHKMNHQEGHKSNNKRQNNFDKNRGIEKEKTDDKKPFDKKAYRLKKYSKKYKLDQWEEQRKKKLLRNLQKDLKSEEGAGTYKPKKFDEDTTDGHEVVGKFVRHPDFIEKEVENKKVPRFLTAKERIEKAKQEKLEKQQQKQKEIDEKKQKMQEYKKKKQEKFKKLSKKTKKGQPVMTGRLELLLEKIQKNK